VFSEPTLPQAEALAWLLTGRGLSGASSDDGSLLASAAVSLGLERSEMVTREIGTALGLDELSVAPGGSLDQSALVLGKALSPRLYIRYALGLLDREGSVQLDYKLTDRISLEAESGARQGADVIYRLER
jgi:translocation and assembly module TamB